MKWQLVKITTDGTYNKYKKKNEEVYHYQSENGQQVAFQSHPTKAFTYLISEGDRRTATKVIDAMIKVALERDGTKTYDELIQQLETK